MRTEDQSIADQLAEDSKAIREYENLNRRKWRHHPGDYYQVLQCRVVTLGGPVDPPEFEQVYYLQDGAPALTIPEAIGRGFYLVDSDDFNIAAFRDGKLAAVLWMNEIVDEEVEVLEEIARQVGCEVVK